VLIACKSDIDRLNSVGALPVVNILSACLVKHVEEHGESIVIPDIIIALKSLYHLMKAIYGIEKFIYMLNFTKQF